MDLRWFVLGRIDDKFPSHPCQVHGQAFEPSALAVRRNPGNQGKLSRHDRIEFVKGVPTGREARRHPELVEARQTFNTI